MSSQELIKIITKAGYQIEEYEEHYCVTGTVECSVVVMIPKSPHIIPELIKKIKEILEL